METAKTVRDEDLTHKRNINELGKLLRVLAPPNLVDALSSVRKPKPTFFQRTIKETPVVLLGVPILSMGMWVLANLLYGVGWVAIRLGLSFGAHGALVLGTLVMLSIGVSIAVLVAFAYASHRVGRWTLDHPVRTIIEEVREMPSRWK